MSTDLSAAVLGFGVCTPLGCDLASTQAAVAAGIANFTETEIMDHNDEPVRASYLSLTPLNATRVERTKVLAEFALSEVFSLANELNIKQLKLFVGLPEAFSGAERSEFKKTFIEQTEANQSIELIIPSQWVYSVGRISFFSALTAAINYIDENPQECALVGAVDSLCDPQTLQTLSYERRVLAEGVDGFLPGEGAVFAIISKRGHKLTEAANSFDIMGPLWARETNHYLQDNPNLGDALSSVIELYRKAPYTGSRRVNSIYCCQTGENYWVKEFNSAYFRNHEIMPEPLEVNFTAESFGETGAAAGALALAMAQAQLAGLCGAEESPRVLVYGSADTGEVAVLMAEANRAIVTAKDQRLQSLKPATR